MKKGVLEMCVLSVVSRGECYGYEAARQLREYYPDVGESAIYAILRRLRSDGALETFHGAVSGGPPRKYYRITATGRTRLAGALEEWKAMAGAVEKLCFAEKE